MLFFQRSQISTAIKLEGGGGLGLNGPAIKRRTFFAASLKKSFFSGLTTKKGEGGKTPLTTKQKTINRNCMFSSVLVNIDQKVYG